MNKINKQGRDYGLDLMRILMTVFVVGIHVLQKGGMFKVCRDAYPRRGFVVMGLFFAVTCAVNGFALISGYVGIKSKYRFSRILWLYFVVSFYNILIPLVFHFRSGCVINETVKLRAIFPFAYDANWYFTAYLGMFLLIPFLNAAVKHLDRKQCLSAFAAIAVFFSVIPTILYMFFDEEFDKNFFKLSSGYSTLWLSVLYIVGASVREHDLFRKSATLGRTHMLLDDNMYRHYSYNTRILPCRNTNRTSFKLPVATCYHSGSLTAIILPRTEASQNRMQSNRIRITALIQYLHYPYTRRRMGNVARRTLF